MKIEIHQITFECTIYRSSNTQHDQNSKWFRARLNCKFSPAANSPVAEFWQGLLNFEEVEKCLLILQSESIATLHLKDASPAISSLALVKINVLRKDEHSGDQVINILADPFFRSYLAGKSFMLDRIIEDRKTVEALEKMKGEVDENIVQGPSDIPAIENDPF